MNRQKIKGTRHKGANNPEQEPNFYSMPFLSATNISSGLCSAKSLCSRPSTPLHSSIGPAVVTPSISTKSFPKVVSERRVDDLLEGMLSKSDASIASFPLPFDVESSSKKLVRGPIYRRNTNVIAPSSDRFCVSAEEPRNNFLRPPAAQSQSKGSVPEPSPLIETGSIVSSWPPDDFEDIFNSDEEKMLIDEESFSDFVW